MGKCWKARHPPGAAKSTKAERMAGEKPVAHGKLIGTEVDGVLWAFPSLAFPTSAGFLPTHWRPVFMGTTFLGAGIERMLTPLSHCIRFWLAQTKVFFVSKLNSWKVPNAADGFLARTSSFPFCGQRKVRRKVSSCWLAHQRSILLFGLAKRPCGHDQPIPPPSIHSKQTIHGESPSTGNPTAIVVFVDGQFAPLQFPIHFVPSPEGFRKLGLLAQNWLSRVHFIYFFNIFYSARRHQIRH